MDTVDLFEERKEIRRVLNKAVADFSDRGRNYAIAERCYRVALAKELYRLKAEGYPATISNDLARGDETVADLKEKRDIAKSLYDSAKEGIQVYKINLRVVEEDISNVRRGT